MADNSRGIHVSPGVYSREIDMNYAVKSLGITTLGLVGETQRGPAFQPMSIENWREFQETFGGTSTEKFVASQYPKYELPYIAKSYLSESNQLEVCRVLGLSGFNAGPAWLLTATIEKTNEEMVVAVLRSRGDYQKYVSYSITSSGDCACGTFEHDKLTYYVGNINYQGYKTQGDKDIAFCEYPKHTWGDALQLSPYTPFKSSNPCAGLEISAGTSNSGYTVQSSDYGHFKLVGIIGEVSADDIISGGTYISGDESLVKKIESGITASGKTYILINNNEYEYFEYTVSLNPADKDYILKVLGTNPQDGTAPIYVESLYDVAFQQHVDAGKIKMLNGKLAFYDNYSAKNFCQMRPVDGFVTKQESELSRRDVGKRFLCTEADFTTAHLYDYSGGTFEINSGETYFAKLQNFYNGRQTSASAVTTMKEDDEAKTTYIVPVIPGEIYTVKQYTDHNRKRHYYYANIVDATVSVGSEEESGKTPSDKQTEYALRDKLRVQGASDSINASVDTRGASIVKNLSDGFYYKARLGENTSGDTSGYTENYDIKRVVCDLNNYKSAYRFASTPWIVSNLKGDYNTGELNKMFRFHTISDGNSSNNEIKISIANIRPDDGTFDVIVRKINDTDASIVPLESFSKCNMIPGSSHYIGYLIGTYNGDYEPKSKYITVEINETTSVKNSVPAGFLGYPLPRYDETQVFDVVSGDSDNDNVLVENRNTTAEFKKIIVPRIAYNVDFDEDTKHRRQYFGLSDRTGVDIDLFTFKGNATYPMDAEDEPTYLTPGFHLDTRIGKMQEEKAYVSVEGIRGYKFDTTSEGSVTDIYSEIPVIGTEEEMYGSIFEYVDLRKFTVYFYGGFDGWDDYRDARTNTDDFKMTKYRGEYNKLSGEGFAFDKLRNPDLYKINEADAITSDYYAYLSAMRQFANPEEVDINVFATPGIDMVNNKLLVEEAIDMIETERADSIYVVTTPDKPYGASDYVDEMYTPDDAVDNLEDTEIDSNYTCTYYPWVKYYDEDNYQYINLPVTKDVVRNMALTDNTTHPWFAPAGISRGDVSCEHAHYVTTIGDEDVLYEGRINPVKTFANDGVKLWGQKNLQIAESQLNRIAVRRLLLRMRKLVAIACRNLIFEPNDNTTKASFISTVTPILDNIKSNRGISDYRLEVNDSIESRERRELPAKIYFKPYNALEYITLDFIVTPEGVSFDQI